VELLTQVLLNHVVSGTVLSSALETGYVNTNATFGDTDNNLSMYINASNDGVLINGETSVSVADNVVDNGVIHAVDKVIGLPSVVTFATADSTFETLVAALTRETSFSYVETLRTANGTEPAPFTVFAPTNDAFTALLNEGLGFDTLDGIPAAVLESTLNTHVVKEENVTADDLSTGANPVSTLGDEFTINVGTDGVTFTDLNGRVGNIIVTDVQAANGVIHVVDKVILPNLTPESNTIVDFVLNNDDYSSLASALQKAGLVNILNGDTDYTVFAPNNESFDAFLVDNGFASLDVVPVDLLTQVLLNHVVSGTFLSSSLETGYVNTNATFGDTDNNLSMYINTASGVLINGETSVSGADNVVDNGVIHAVDAVIGLPTVVTFATADSNFGTLVTALTTETPDVDYVSILSRTETGNNDGINPSFTVFAPTNDAFTALLNEGLGFSTLDGIPDATLVATLNTHVVAEANDTAGDLSDGDNTIETLGDDFTINVNGSAITFTDLNDRTGDIIATDVQAVNGVIHVVDTVILPAL
jgi:transforming growth factor-beta-induced protein